MYLYKSYDPGLAPETNYIFKEITGVGKFRKRSENPEKRLLKTGLILVLCSSGSKTKTK
jgi:hypothetical protein